jgi:hypothetical protein
VGGTSYDVAGYEEFRRRSKDPARSPHRFSRTENGFSRNRFFLFGENRGRTGRVRAPHRIERRRQTVDEVFGIGLSGASRRLRSSTFRPRSFLIAICALHRRHYGPAHKIPDSPVGRIAITFDPAHGRIAFALNGQRTISTPTHGLTVTEVKQIRRFLNHAGFRRGAYPT